MAITAEIKEIPGMTSENIPHDYKGSDTATRQACRGRISCIKWTPAIFGTDIEQDDGSKHATLNDILIPGLTRTHTATLTVF